MKKKIIPSDPLNWPTVQCGGKGKEGNIPPPEYNPDCFVDNKTCNICGEGYDTNSKLRDHVQNVHRMFITKSWSKDALLNIGLYEQYETWLWEKFDMEIEKVSLQNKKMPKYNENNIPETFLKVSQKGNIIETRREIITPNKDGTFKRSVLTEQYANISKRKHERIDRDFRTYKRWECGS